MSEQRRFNNRERRALALYSRFRCEICRARLEKFEADHVVPWSKGGKTDVRNGQALCTACNRRKGAKHETS